MITWPSTLVDDIARRKCVIVLGAGVSMSSTSPAGVRPKNWPAFLREGASRMGTPKALQTDVVAIINSDPLTACEMIRNKLGVQAFADLCRSEFLDPGYRHARIHELVHLLDSRIVMTPNLDIIYESYVSSTQKSPAIVKTYRDADLAEAIRLPGRVILKIHGTIHSPRDMVFTRSDYATARNQYSNAYAIVSALALTSTFLFLGCGLTDPDTTLLLEDYAFRFHVGRAHYMTLPQTEAGRVERRHVIETTRNLRLLTYDPVSGHKALLDSLENLVVQVVTTRQQLSKSQNW